MHGDPTTLEREELIARLRWLIGLRWAFGAGVAIIGLLLTRTTFVEVRGLAIACVGMVILLYNLIFRFIDQWLIKAHPIAHGERAPLAACSQIVLDMMTLTLVLHFSGGVENPFLIFYVFHVIIATLLLPVRDVFMLAGFAILLFSSMALGEMNNWWSHVDLFELHDLYKQPQAVLGILLAFASSLLIAVYLGTSIARQLRSREQEVLELRSELAARAEDLEQTNEALRELDEAKTRHYRKISHELKAPLAAQRSLLDAAIIELNDTVSEQTKARIRRAASRSDEMLGLVADLMLLSESREFARRGKPEWLRPLEHLQPLLDDQALRAKAKGLTWRVVADKPLPDICAEPRALPMLVENLISNAIKYTPAGGSVTFSLDADNGFLIMRVRDTGMGISNEDLKRIGQEFFRTSQARESGIGGTGLGMTIVRSIVNAMKGDVTIQSELGKGTNITVRLPVRSTQEAPKKQ